MNKLALCLWFNGQIEEAANFYTSVFKDSRIVKISKYVTETPGGQKPGEPMLAELEINGMQIQLLNGGNFFKLSEAVSLVVSCEDQSEVDYYWEKLIEGGGEESVCGWLKDKYGVSWQIVPKRLIEFTTGEDVEKAKKVFEVMMKMKKINIAQIEEAINS